MGRLLPLIEVPATFVLSYQILQKIQGVCNDGDDYQNVFIYFTGKR